MYALRTINADPPLLPRPRGGLLAHLHERHTMKTTLRSFARGFVPPGEPAWTTLLLSAILAAAALVLGWWAAGGEN